MRLFRKYFGFVALLFLLAAMPTEAFAVCQGPSGVPFNCTSAVAGPFYNDLVMGGVTSGAQNGQSIRWTWGQVFTGTTLTSPLIINGTISSLNTPLAGADGGTGVANTGSTITLGGNILTTGTFTIAGTHALTFNLTGDTTMTLPTSGSFLGTALLNTHVFVGNVSNVAADVAVSGDCAISNTGVLTCTKINTKTVALVGNLTTTGGTSTLSIALAGNTSVTLPTTGTLLAVVPNLLAGCVLSNDGGTPNSKLDSAACTAADSTNAQMITIGAFVKSTAGAWASGTGNNGMGNGLTVANNTWYHVCLAFNGGTPDEWYDTSAACANKPVGISGTLFRRIGSFKTATGTTNILLFSQNANRFDWSTPIVELTASVPGITTAIPRTLLGAPLGVVTEAIMAGEVVDATNSNSGMYVSSLAQTDVAANGATAITVQTGTASATVLASFSGFRVFTDVASQIRLRVNFATTTINLQTNGWVDTRGQ